MGFLRCFWIKLVEKSVEKCLFCSFLNFKEKDLSPLEGFEHEFLVISGQKRLSARHWKSENTGKQQKRHFSPSFSGIHHPCVFCYSGLPGSVHPSVYPRNTLGYTPPTPGSTRVHRALGARKRLVPPRALGRVLSRAPRGSGALDNSGQ